MSETTINLSESPAKKPFVFMVVLSLLVHVSVTTFLFLLQGHGNGSLVTTVDLSVDPSVAATTSAPPRQVVAVKSAPPAEVPVEEEASPAPEAPVAPSPYEELQQEVRTAREKAASDPGALDSISFGLGMTNGYFSTLAEGKTLRPDIREYYLALLQKINESWWLGKKGEETWTGGATFNITIDRSGAVVNLELAKSSGNRAWDTRMLESIKAAGNLPPLPASYNDLFFRAPLRFVAPLNMMLGSATSPH